VVEGQFDVLQLYSRGVKNVVALSGNKMSEAQMAVMHRYCKEIVLLLDTDTNKAGQLGAAKVMGNASAYESGRKRKLFALQNFDNYRASQTVVKREILSVNFSENLDPDEFVKKYGIGKLKEMIKEQRREFSSSKSKY
jgi:DNA primase